jgi:HSP20 family protein
MPAEGHAAPKTEVTATTAATPQAWNPFLSLRQEMDRLFDGFSARWPFDGRGEMTPWNGFAAFDAIPATDMVEKEKEYVVTAELPGVEEKDIEVTLHDDILTIRAEKTQEKREEKKDYHLSERRYGSYHRSFRLPAVDASKVEASYKKGVLTVTLPKSAEAQAKQRKIKIKT